MSLAQQTRQKEIELRDQFAMAALSGLLAGVKRPYKREDVVVAFRAADDAMEIRNQPIMEPPQLGDQCKCSAFPYWHIRQQKCADAALEIRKK